MISTSPLNQLQTMGIPPELDVLLHCARIDTTPEVAMRIRITLRQPFQWDYLIDLAKFHKVVPLLYQSLSRVCPDLVPDERRTQLRKLYYANTYQNLFLTQELILILKNFETHGIPAISFKGPTLAILAYDEVSFRQIGDLDFLLPKHAIQQARELLIAQGFQLTGNYEWEYHFSRVGGAVHVDIHQEIAPIFFDLPFTFANLWSRVQYKPFGGTAVPHPKVEDLLLLLSQAWCRDCVYFNSHISLHLLSDVDALLQRYALDWTGLFAQARTQGCDRILKLLLLSVHDLLGTALPQAVFDAIQTNPLPPSLLLAVKKRLLEDPMHLRPRPDKAGFWEAIGTYDHLFYLQARERLRDRLRYCFNWIEMGLAAAIRPNESDWQLVSLPKSLLLLYYPLHVIRLIFKHGLRLPYQRLWARK
jgi:hypothetical protein